ncbi:MAG: hypothetical protein JNM46_06200, partial [Anaerolineales bacterium]|nr:hypothetical protein [Anaerolineales bacterium]
MTSIFIFTLLIILSAIGVWMIRHYAHKKQILDHPNERSSHALPTPRGGGLAIVLLVIGTAITSMKEAEINHAIVYIFCGIIIAFLGWRDDVSSLSPKVRFIVQGLVAAISIYALGYFKSVTIPLFGELQLGVVGIIITFLWILGLTNAYNFMDGIDGIAGGVALAGACAWMFISSNMGNNFVF